MILPRPTDTQLIEKVRRFEAAVEQWATTEELWFECGFQSYAERVDGEPGNPPVITILYFGQEFHSMLYEDIPGARQFEAILKQHGLWYEHDTSCTLNFYLEEEEGPLVDAFADFARWQWICSLIQPDFADVTTEIYQHFALRPTDLESLHWRDYEILLHRIFQARGFHSELGPGSNDGGIDIKLLQRDPLGDLLTLVQAKRYDPKNRIGLEAVQALHGAAAVEQAPKSIFVTTSTYQPSAQKFAARTSGALELCTSSEVVEWCKQAHDGIIRDKSSLVSPATVLRILDEVSARPDARVVHANVGVTMILNAFALILKESEHAALLMSLPLQTVSDDGHGQVGFEVPRLDSTALANFNADSVWRAKRQVRNGRADYWNGKNLYSPWRGQPEHFSWLD